MDIDALASSFVKVRDQLEKMHRFLGYVEGTLQDQGLWDDEEQDLLEENEKIIKEANQIEVDLPEEV